jgi:hypothetical protein
MEIRLGERERGKIALGLAFFLLGLFLLFAGERAYRYLTIIRPLKSALRGDTYRWEDRGGFVRIRLTLPPTGDPVAWYREREESLRPLLEEGKVRLEPEDRPDEELAGAWRELAPIVQEARATGRYTAIEESLASVARKHGLDQVTMVFEEDKLYLYLGRGRNYVFRVFPLSAAARFPEEPGPGL